MPSDFRMGTSVLMNSGNNTLANVDCRLCVLSDITTCACV